MKALTEYLVHQLEQNKLVLQALLEASDEKIYTWRPQPEKWCLLEIACHLYDEEREDFRARVKHVLETPDEPMPPINPTAWVLERKYLEKNYLETLKAFLTERDHSLAWLRGLKDPHWENAYQHPKVGPISAFMLLSNWVEHDYLHIRQILNLRHFYLAETSGQDLNYAGNW